MWRLKMTVLPIAGVFALGTGGYLATQQFAPPDAEIPMGTARRGGFVRMLTVTGQLQARRASTLAAPRVRNLQIAWMAADGSHVAAGDTVIRFTSTQQQADLQSHRTALQIAETTLERARKELALQERLLAVGLEEARRRYDEEKYEAPRIAAEAKLRLEAAELNHNVKLEQQRADVAKAAYEVQRARDQVALAQRELEQLTLTAPIAGMVVHLETWRGNIATKVQPGDSPYQGQPLITLPDLSEMVLKATIPEVDANLVETGQEAWVTVDAFPDRTYQAKVERKGTLAHHKEPNSKINVFDVELVLIDTDAKLRPGLSATARILVDQVALLVAVPLEAVFERDGRFLVYLEDRMPREVQVGRRNDQEIEIVSGLEGGERLCLVEPTGKKPRAPQPAIAQVAQWQALVEAHPASAAAGPVPPPPPKEPNPCHRVQIFASASRTAAEAVCADLQTRFDLPAVVDSEPPYFKVRVGACDSRSGCVDLLARLRTAGYAGAFVTPAAGETTPRAP